MDNLTVCIVCLAIACICNSVAIILNSKFHK